MRCGQSEPTIQHSCADCTKTLQHQTPSTTEQRVTAAAEGSAQDRRIGLFLVLKAVGPSSASRTYLLSAPCKYPSLINKAALSPLEHPGLLRLTPNHWATVLVTDPEVIREQPCLTSSLCLQSAYTGAYPLLRAAEGLYVVPRAGEEAECLCLQGVPRYA